MTPRRWERQCPDAAHLERPAPLGLPVDPACRALALSLGQLQADGHRDEQPDPPAAASLLAVGDPACVLARNAVPAPVLDHSVVSAGTVTDSSSSGPKSDFDQGGNIDGLGSTVC